MKAREGEKYSFRKQEPALIAYSTIHFVLSVKTLPNFYDETTILLMTAMARFEEGKEDI